MNTQGYEFTDFSGGDGRMALAAVGALESLGSVSAISCELPENIARLGVFDAVVRWSKTKHVWNGPTG